MAPLDDLSVVELCRGDMPLHLRLAAAMAGRLAADQGARVLCLAPPGQDPLRAVPPLVGGESATGAFLSAGKDILYPADAREWEAAANRLLATRPVAVIMAEAEPLREAFAAAGVAVIELATWSREFQHRHKGEPVNDFAVLASSGLLDIIGDPSREPLRLGGHQIAYSGGLSAFTALMAAITQHDRDGRALHARISLLETGIWLNWKAVVGAAEPPPHPSRRGDLADFPVLRCKDGWTALVYTSVQFDRLEAMFSELTLTNPQRLPAEERGGALAAQVSGWFAARTREEIYARAREFGIPIGPVYTPAELLDDEQYRARDFIPSPVSETASVSGLRFPRLPMTWNGERLAIRASRELSFDDLAESAA